MGQRIVANTVSGNVTAGINLEQGSTGATVTDNVAVDNGIDSPRTYSDIRVDSSSVAGTAMDHDRFFLAKPGTLLVWNSKSYASLSVFRSATGQEAHAVLGSGGLL